MKSVDKGKIYEDSLVEEYKGTKEPGSGNKWCSGQDVRAKISDNKVLFQAKNVSGQKSFSLKREDLQKLRRDASKTGRIGIFTINFGEKEEYFVLRKDDFNFMCIDESC